MTMTMSVEMPDSFSIELRLLLTGLLQRDVGKRLGCRGRGADEIKSHPFFSGIDWRVVFLQRLTPPLMPARGEVNAADAFDIGSFDDEDTKHIKLSDADQELYRNFPVVVSERWQHEIAETIFDYINHEADKAEMKRKNKGQKLGFHGEEEQSDCILHGYIKRLGGTFTATWLTRYVRLYPNRLELWSDSGKQPELIFMDQIEEVCNDYVQIKNEQCIVIKLYNHSKYVLTNSDEIGLKEWHVSLKAAHRDSLDLMTTMAEKATKIYGTEIPVKHMGKRRQQLQQEASNSSASSAIANLEQKIIQKELQASVEESTKSRSSRSRSSQQLQNQQSISHQQATSNPSNCSSASHKHHRGHHQHRTHHHRHHHHEHQAGGQVATANSSISGGRHHHHHHHHHHVSRTKNQQSTIQPAAAIATIKPVKVPVDRVESVKAKSVEPVDAAAAVPAIIEKRPIAPQPADTSTRPEELAKKQDKPAEINEATKDTGAKAAHPEVSVQERLKSQSESLSSSSSSFDSCDSSSEPGSSDNPNANSDKKDLSNTAEIQETAAAKVEVDQNQSATSEKPGQVESQDKLPPPAVEEEKEEEDERAQVDKEKAAPKVVPIDVMSKLEQDTEKIKLAVSLENVSEHQEVLRDPSKRITSDNKQRELDLVAQYEKLNTKTTRSSTSSNDE